MREDCLSIYPRTKKTLTDGWWLPTYSLKLKERGGFQDLDGLPTLSIYPIHPDGSWNRFSFCFILHTHAHTLPFFDHTIHTYTLKWTALSILLCGLEAAVTVTVYTTQYCDERWLLPHRLTLGWLLYSWLFRSVLVLVVVSLSSHPCQELVLYIYIFTHTHKFINMDWIGWGIRLNILQTRAELNVYILSKHKYSVFSPKPCWLFLIYFCCIGS